MNRRLGAALTGAALLAFGGATGAVLSTEATESETTTVVLPVCGVTGQPLDESLCTVQGVLLYGMFYNIQGAGQFCKWSAANPGEWARIKGYVTNPSVPPERIVTWFGAALRDAAQAYAYAEAVAGKAVPPNNVPNKCKTPLSPPSNLQVTTTGG